jgi:gluconolactonase
MAQTEPDQGEMILDDDPFVILDPRFAPLVVQGGRAERLWTGSKWTEGPAWFDAGYLVWSDIPGNRMMRWDEATNAVSVFRHPAASSNGNTVDREGRLVTCEQHPRRVARTEVDGSTTVLAAAFDGKRFNSPNDVVVKSDGTIWFTDPSYGVGGEGYEGVREMEGCHVYRADPATGDVRQMTSDFYMPNGLAFSPDESLLYIVDTGGTNFPEAPNHVRRFAVGPDGTLSGGEELLAIAKLHDGLRVDSEGRLWCANEEGVHCHAPDGTLLGKLRLPERASNLTFGGQSGNWLLITATTSVYRVPVNARAARHP